MKLVITRLRESVAAHAESTDFDGEVWAGFGDQRVLTPDASVEDIERTVTVLLRGFADESIESVVLEGFRESDRPRLRQFVESQVSLVVEGQPKTRRVSPAWRRRLFVGAVGLAIGGSGVALAVSAETPSSRSARGPVLNADPSADPSAATSPPEAVEAPARLLNLGNLEFSLPTAWELRHAAQQLPDSPDPALRAEYSVPGSRSRAIVMRTPIAPELAIEDLHKVLTERRQQAPIDRFGPIEVAHGSGRPMLEYFEHPVDGGSAHWRVVIVGDQQVSVGCQGELENTDATKIAPHDVCEAIVNSLVMR